MLNAGQLDRRITIERSSVVYDADNQPVTQWFTLATVWASKKDLSDGEKVRAAQVGSTLTTRFQIRWSALVADLNPKDRIVLGGLTYDIHGVKEIGRREGFEITAAAGSDADPTDIIISDFMAQSPRSGRCNILQTFVSYGAGADMLGNDYVWKDMVDPIDSNVGQIDTVGSDNDADGSEQMLEASRFLQKNGRFRLHYAVNAKGGTLVAPDWQPNAVDSFDKSTLWGSSAYRTRLAKLKYPNSRIAFYSIIGISDAVDGTTKADFKAGFLSAWLPLRAMFPGSIMLLSKFYRCTDAAALAGSVAIWEAIDELIGTYDIYAAEDSTGLLSDDDFHLTSQLKQGISTDLRVPAMQRAFNAAWGLGLEIGLVPSSNFVRDFWAWTRSGSRGSLIAEGDWTRRTTSADTLVNQAVVSNTFNLVTGQRYTYGALFKYDGNAQIVQMCTSSSFTSVGYANFDILNATVTQSASCTPVILPRPDIGEDVTEVQIYDTVDGSGNACSIVANVVETSTTGRNGNGMPNTSVLMSKPYLVERIGLGQWQAAA